MPSPRLLLIDPDAASRGALASELRGGGFEVQEASSSSEAPPLAETTAVLVADGSTVSVDALGGIAASGRPVFVVVQGDLTPEREKALLAVGVARVLAAGPQLPAELQSILTATPPASPVSTVAMVTEGVFSPDAIITAFRYVGMRSAVITLVSEVGDVGTIWLRQGRIINVQQGSLAPGRALARIFTWAQGQFRLEIDEHDHAEAISLEARLGGEEALRRAEVWHRLVASLGGIGAVFKVDYVALARQLSEIPDDANVMLRLVDGQRPLAEIVEQVPFDELHTLAVALKLRVDGVIVPAVVPEVEVPSESQPLEMVPAEHPPGQPLITVQAIDEALEWVAAPSMIPWTPAQGHIPVVQFTSRRGSRRERLLQSALELRHKAAQLDERPMLLTDEVLAPGALPLPTAIRDRTEILVSAARSPVSSGRSDSSRRVMLALAFAAICLAGVIVLQSVRSPEPPVVAPVATATPVVAPPVEIAVPPPPAPTPEPAPSLPAPVAAPKKAPAAPPPATYEALYKAGTQASAQGNYEKAISLLEQAVARKKTAPAFLELGKSYYAADRLEKAIASLTQATQLDARSATAFMYLGMASQDAHRAAEARAAYKRFLELEPSESPRHAEIASVLNHL